MGTPVCDAASMFSQTSGRRGLGSGNQKNSGVRCLVVGTIRREARSSRIDAHPRRVLGDDIGLCVRRWTGRGTRWIRRPWLKPTRWTLVAGIFFKALLKSIDGPLNWALFSSSLWTSRPRSQRGRLNNNTTRARESFCVAGIRPAGVGPPSEGSVRIQAAHRFLPPAQGSRLWRMPRRMVRT
jgi:hypothetical protein